MNNLTGFAVLFAETPENDPEVADEGANTEDPHEDAQSSVWHEVAAHEEGWAGLKGGTSNTREVAA